MSRILHAAFMVRAPSGILNQMQYEQTSTSKLGLTFDSKLVVADKNRLDIFPSLVELLNSNHQRNSFFKWMRRRRQYVKWLFERSSSYDAIIIRWNVSDPFLNELIRNIQIPVFTIHHTFESNELSINAKFGNFRSLVDNALFRRASRFSAGIIGVTDEIVDYEKKRAVLRLPSYVYPNGITFNDNIDYGPDIGKCGVPKFVFVASHFSPWQGLDLLLTNARASSERFELHVIGSVPNELREVMSRDDRIHAHGTLSQEDLAEVYSYCDIGLSAFALHRKGMRQACSLKVRDYLKHGMPVYASHDDIFPHSFPYYRNGEPSIDDIVAYHQEMLGQNRSDIAKESRPYIDKMSLVKGLYDWLETMI